MNSNDPEPLTGFEPKFAQIVTIHMGDELTRFTRLWVKGDTQICECYNGGRIHFDGVSSRLTCFFTEVGRDTGTGFEPKFAQLVTIRMGNEVTRFTRL